MPGTEAISICVYASRGNRSTCSFSPASTCLPFCKTMTRSAISATTPMSCVMNNTAVPRSRCNVLMSASTSACVVTSSAVVGSSAISNFGSRINAIAIMMRWR